MREHKLKVPYTGKERRVRVLLPKDYEKDTDRFYPVVYFHDGQNVFYSKESYIGHSWKIIPAIKRNPDISRMIVVAIDNDGMGRMNEYAAWKFQESPIPGQQFGGKGVEYAEFVMEVVKPFIDETYRTKADRQHTAMIGSSLGGNITQFIGLEYQDRIGCLGVFSSANWLHQEAFNRYIERKKLTPEQRIFIYVGTEEADDTDTTLQKQFGVWAEKKMYGRTYMGTLRYTFLIDENGVIEKVIEKVDTKNHAQQILNEK